MVNLQTRMEWKYYLMRKCKTKQYYLVRLQRNYQRSEGMCKAFCIAHLHVTLEWRPSPLQGSGLDSGLWPFAARHPPFLTLVPI